VRLTALPLPFKIRSMLTYLRLSQRKKSGKQLRSALVFGVSAHWLV
jgi:hypothetical protein